MKTVQETLVRQVMVMAWKPETSSLVPTKDALAWSGVVELLGGDTFDSSFKSEVLQ